MRGVVATSSCRCQLFFTYITLMEFTRRSASCRGRCCFGARPTTPLPPRSFLSLLFCSATPLNLFTPFLSVGLPTAHQCKLRICRRAGECKGRSSFYFRRCRQWSFSRQCCRRQIFFVLTIFVAMRWDWCKEWCIFWRGRAIGGGQGRWECHYRSILIFSSWGVFWQYSENIDRYLNAKLFNDHLGVTSSENKIFVPAFSALIIGHVLDYSEDGDS